jgi:hypothetical protein
MRRRRRPDTLNRACTFAPSLAAAAAASPCVALPRAAPRSMAPARYCVATMMYVPKA